MMRRVATVKLTASDIEERVLAARRGRILQYLTIAWNSAECVVALIAGSLASSIALVGFGFDSAIEVTSSLAALWRLRSDANEAQRESVERLTLRVIGTCFLLLWPLCPPWFTSSGESPADSGAARSKLKRGRRGSAPTSPQFFSRDSV